MSNSKIILVTEASEGVGPLIVGALAHGGHIVYAAVDGCTGSASRQAVRFRSYAAAQGVDVRPITLDPTADRSVGSASRRIMREMGRIDAVIHNGMQPIFGPAEAFLPAQLATSYDRSILGAQRVMRAILPHMRHRSQGLVVWLASNAAAGGAAPCHAFHCSIAAGVEAMAVQYARELARWGIETSIVMPGLFGELTNPFRDALRPDDTERVVEYEAGPNRGLGDAVRSAGLQLVSNDDVPGAAAGAVAMIVDTPFGERPFRVHVDPAQDGADVAASVMDRIREEMIRRLGFADLLEPHHAEPQASGDGMPPVPSRRPS